MHSNITLIYILSETNNKIFQLFLQAGTNMMA